MSTVIIFGFGLMIGATAVSTHHHLKEQERLFSKNSKENTYFTKESILYRKHASCGSCIYYSAKDSICSLIAESVKLEGVCDQYSFNLERGITEKNAKKESENTR